MNRAILAGVVLIGVTGSITALIRKQPVTPILVGSYVLLVILALLDLFGGPISKIAGGIALVAGLAVFLTEGLPILQLVSPQNLQKITLAGAFTPPATPGG